MTVTSPPPQEVTAASGGNTSRSAMTAMTAAGGVKEGTASSSSSSPPPPSFVDILNSSNYNQHRSNANSSSTVLMNGGYKQQGQHQHVVPYISIYSLSSNNNVEQQHRLSKQQQHQVVMTSPKMSKQHIYSAIGSLEHSYGSGNSGPLSIASSAATVSVQQGSSSYQYANAVGTTPPHGIGVTVMNSAGKVCPHQLNRNHLFSHHPHYRSHFLTPRSGSVGSKDEHLQQQQQHQQQQHGNTGGYKSVQAQHVYQEEDHLMKREIIRKDIVAVGKSSQMGQQDVQDAFDPFRNDCNDQRQSNERKQIGDSVSVSQNSTSTGAHTTIVALYEGPKSQQKYHGNLDRQLQESDARAKQQEHEITKKPSPVTTPETHLSTPFTSMNTMEKSGSETNLQGFMEETKMARKKSRKKKKKVKINGIATETFRPSCDAYTPRVNAKKIDYKPAKERSSQAMSTKMGTLSRPNFRDALRRVAMIIHQHITKIERRNEEVPFTNHPKGLFNRTMMENFSEDNFVSPRYKCTMVRIPMARTGVVCSMKKIKTQYEIPMEDEIYEFAHKLFKTVQLSSECSIVCLIYVERLMEVAKVPLMAHTWRPIVMCGLLLASKVWQDLSSWNIEFSTVYPQFSLEAINKLELLFLRQVKWDLYISSSLYAKYYFALRSLLEKKDFRQRYNRMVGAAGGVDLKAALEIQKRTVRVKEESLSQLSRSM
eukprot:CAMPEP_0196819696 /NCGR_PEP_ID=MMETSP1362-20130617/71770_1 /TAXON_ID=163516 /ORGANISM="Leptocylindrus danicus, Strain CCMP1856" /LENGTH=707 /DNA_ID=CAMNT_0042198277 /DNA_START=506 /DNA_END=2629 /DNA_ORIENTATION=+